MANESYFPVETFPADRLFVEPTQGQLMHLLQPYLGQDETVLWQGQPNPSIEAGRYKVSPLQRKFLIAASVALMALAAYTFLTPPPPGIHVGMKLAFVFLFGLPGLFLFAIFLSSFENLDRLVPRNTFYVITNKRAIRFFPERPSFHEDFVWKVESFYPQEINIAPSYQSFDKGKFYNIKFARDPQTEATDVWSGFNSIEDPEVVIEALREVRKLNPDVPKGRYDDIVPQLGLEAKGKS